jgi:putative flippase GtrA
MFNHQHVFIKFILVGTVNTLFSYAVFSLLIFCGLHYTLALLIATVLGVLFNFKTFGKLVFRNTNNKLFFKFILIYAALYLFNVVALKILLSYAINVYVAGMITTIIAALLSYILNKEFVFKEARV